MSTQGFGLEGLRAIRELHLKSHFRDKPLGAPWRGDRPSRNTPGPLRLFYSPRVSLFGKRASCRHADIELKKRSHKRFSLRRERDTLTWECLRKAYALMGKPRRFEPFFPVMLCRIIYIMSTVMGKRHYWASPRALFSGSVIGSDRGDGLGQRV